MTGFRFENKSDRKTKNTEAQSVMQITGSSDENWELCLKIMESESRAEAIKHLKDAGYWDDERCWRAYGGKESNWSQVANQQSNPDNALVEKLTNAMDAVLINACKEQGLDPEGDDSSDTPQTMKSAAERFFVSDLAELGGNERTRYAQHIKLIATGAKPTKSSPNLIIADAGEGQTPQDMPSTLLSLDENNKNKIPFVQGAFNMGGTGVFGVSGGKDLLQLVVTRKNPKIVEKDKHYAQDPTADLWGFTIVRVFRPKGNEKKPILKYLAPEPNGEVLSFAADVLPILPDEKRQSEGSMAHGTFIKLYEYKLSQRKYHSQITLHLYYRLSLLLPEPVLPIRLLERRGYSKTDNPQANMSGIRVRLQDNEEKVLEQGFAALPISFAPLKFEGHSEKIKGTLYVFKKDVQMDNYRKNEGVVFTVNGQYHDDMSRVWFKNECGLSYLSDTMLILIDCSELSSDARDEMFKASRDRKADTDFRRTVEKELADFITNHEGLQQLNYQRRKERLSDKTKDDKPFADRLQSIIKRHPSLISWFGVGAQLSDPSGGDSNREPVELKRFPDYFKPRRSFPQDKPKGFSLQQDRFKISYIANAETDYFARTTDPGRLTVRINGEPYEYHKINPWGGRATLHIYKSEDWQADQLLRIETEISDIDRESKGLEPFRHEFYVLTNDSDVRPSKPSKKNSERTPEKQGGTNRPNPVEVWKEDWSNHGFDAHSALKSVSNPQDGEYDFYINMDNIHLNNEIKDKEKDAAVMREQYKTAMALFGISMLVKQQDKKRRPEAEDGGEPSSQIDDETLPEIAKQFAPFILPIISLAELDE